MKISVRNIAKKFGSTIALDSVSADFEGKINLILGTNGSGKTTLLNSLAGLTFPNSGILEVDGKLFNASRKSSWSDGASEITSRYRLGFLLDKQGFPSSFSGREMLESTMKSSRVSVQDGWLKLLTSMLDMSAYIDDRIGRYSSGMMQKLGIATSLSNMPELVFWDEPTSNLDARGRQEVTQLVKELSESKDTVFLIISHNPSEFEGIADWIGYMSLGRMISSGRIGDYAAKSLRYQATTKEPKRLAAQLLTMGIATTINLFENEVVFTSLSDSMAILDDASRLASETGCEVTELRRIPMSISELYRDFSK